MNKRTPILTDDQALAYACDHLAERLTLKAEGYKCTTDDLIHVLVAIASQATTVEQACAALPATPDATTVRTYFNTQLTTAQLAELEQQVNAALQVPLPPRLWHKPLNVALDVHNQPYYGRTPQAEGLWVKGQEKAGTHRCYRIATAYVMERGLRVTLAVVFMPYGVTQLTALQALLAQIRRLKLPVRCLYCDRGFADVPTMQYLHAHGWAAVIACPIRGKLTGKGTKALCQGRSSYVTTHTFERRDGKASYTAQLAVCRAYHSTGPRSHRQRRACWEIYIMINLVLTPQQLRPRYRHRFGIETSYRCANQVRAWTTSPNVAYRFLLLGLAFFIYNVWVYFVWLYTQVPRKGGRYLDVARLRLARLKRLLLHALEARYGSVTSVTAPAVPRL